MRTIEEMREFFKDEAVILCNSAEDMLLMARVLQDNHCELDQVSTVRKVFDGWLDIWEQSRYQSVYMYYDRTFKRYYVCGHTGKLASFNSPVFSVSDVVDFFSEPTVPFTEQEFDAAFADLLQQEVLS